MKKSKKQFFARKNLKKEVLNLVSYFIGGGVWFWTGYVLIVAFDGPLIAQFGEAKGLFIANLIGNTVGFSLNLLVLRLSKFNTKKPGSIGSTTRRYYVYTILNVFGLNYLILLGLKQVGIEPQISQFIASGFFTVWNYYWYKVYVFKEPEPVKKKRVARA